MVFICIYIYFVDVISSLQPDFYKTFIQDKHKILILVSYTKIFSLFFFHLQRYIVSFDYNVAFSHLNIFRMSFTYLLLYSKTTTSTRCCWPYTNIFANIFGKNIYISREKNNQKNKTLTDVQLLVMGSKIKKINKYMYKILILLYMYMLLLSYVLSKAAYLFHGFRKFSTKYLDKYFFLFYSRRGGVWIDVRKKDKKQKKI